MPTVLPIVIVHKELLLEYLDCLFTEFICLWVAGSRQAHIDVDLSVQVFEEF